MGMADQVGSWGKMGQTGRWDRMVPGGIPAGRVEARGRDLTMAAWGSQLHLTDLVWKREFYAFKRKKFESTIRLKQRNRRMLPLVTLHP